MGERIEVFVRPIRGSNEAFGHVFYVYIRADGTKSAISLAPLEGTKGMWGGDAALNIGDWGPSHTDWRVSGERAEPVDNRNQN